MTEETLLGLDIGTSSTKAVLVRPDGVTIAQAQRTHELSLPRPGWAEHDAERIWWSEVRSLCSELVPASRGGLRGICVSGIGPCAVPCDAQLRTLRPAILYGIDTRATDEIAELENALGADEILIRCGSALSSQALGPKLLWLRHHEPQIWQRTAGWYMANSFVAARLTGEYFLDHHSASQCDPLYDLDVGDWAYDWADAVTGGVPLPRLVWPNEVVGVVTADAARETGLPQGAPVVAGTIDSWAEAFSAGVRQPGDLMLQYGSTLFLIQLANTPTPDPLLWSTQAVERGQRSLAAGMATAGVLTDWLRDLIGRPDWASLLSNAARVPAGCHGLLLLPYFAGERTPIYDPQARGVIAGLTLRHGAPELLRAVYEGTAFGVHQILELFSGAAHAPKRLVAVGGGTQADLWLQIVSDVTGAEQQVPEQTIGACYGDALLAAIGTGLVPVETNWTTIAKAITPSASSHDLYREISALYSRLYGETAEIVHRLAAIDRLAFPEEPEPALV